MVFSQTSLNTQTVLKVVELDRLKNGKKDYSNGLNGVITDGYSSTPAPSSPVATTSSFAEVYLKPEPLFESAMFHDTDYEFFQDLVPLSCDPAKEEVVQTIDSSKKTEERALKIDTPYTPFSPQGWETLDVNSQFPQSAGLYNHISPHEPLSPNEKFPQYDINMPTFPEWDKEHNPQFKETFLDISRLPVVIGDLASGMVANTNPWQAQDTVELTNTHDTQYYHMYTNPTQNTAPFIDAEDSLDLKFGSVIPREVESNNVVISEFIINEEQDLLGVMKPPAVPRRAEGLSVDVSARAPAWPYDTISTPEVLSYVEQLEKEKCSQPLKPSEHWPVQNVSLPTSKEMFTDLSLSTTKETFSAVTTPPAVEYEPITPKSESHLESDNDDVKSTASKRRRQDSDESDETYTPYSEQPSRKYRKRKPSVPIKDMILALDSQPKARRGRPPKRRESTVSSVCSVDDNSSSISTQEFKYRELRDKNNEASKRSRMNRKLKELQMEQLADELEEKNKKLRVRADILEEMTKRLKNELMSAILKSK
uniref:BZIP domain-containing protein n=2 Tax=Heliothis virescens TaxID=7102 RepID=A0A2A4ISV9_HELVI